MDDKFSFKNKSVRIWLLSFFSLALLISYASPPAFWLCGVGAVLIAITSLMISARTGRWNTWDGGREEPITWFEGFTASIGVIAMATPLAVVIFRVFVS